MFCTVAPKLQYHLNPSLLRRIGKAQGEQRRALICISPTNIMLGKRWCVGKSDKFCFAISSTPSIILGGHCIKILGRNRVDSTMGFTKNMWGISSCPSFDRLCFLINLYIFGDNSMLEQTQQKSLHVR